MTTTKIKLWKHQKDGVNRAKKQWALFWEEGTGKTYVYIEILKKYKIKRALIIVPKTLILQWEDIISEYAADLDITLDTFDRVARRVDEYGAQSFDAIVLDEASKIKRWTSRRTRAICRLSSKYPRALKIIGTGTPIGNQKGKELFGYARFLFGADSPFGEGYQNFLKRFYEQEDFSLEWEPKDDTEDRLRKLISPWSDRIRKSECITLPDKVYSTIRLRPLRGNSNRLYRGIREAGIALIEGRLVEAKGVATVIQKLQQLTQGVIYANDKREDYLHKLLEDRELVFSGNLDNPKLEWLVDNIEELLAGGDVMVVGTYTRALELVADTLQKTGLAVGRFFGSHTSNLRGPWQVLVANESRIAFGHNLQRLSSVVFFGNSWSLEERRQTENRAHRAGQKERVTVYDLVIPYTVDRYVIDRIREYSDFSKSILRDFGEHF